MRISQGVHAFLKKNDVPHVWHVDGHAHDLVEWKNNLLLVRPAYFSLIVHRARGRQRGHVRLIDHHPGWSRRTGGEATSMAQSWTRSQLTNRQGISHREAAEKSLVDEAIRRGMGGARRGDCSSQAC